MSSVRESSMTGAAAAPPGASSPSRRRSSGTHLFLLVMGIIWLMPLLWTLFTSLRSQADTNKYGYFSLGGSFNLDNYLQAWSEGQFPTHLMSSAIITIPAVLLTLLLASVMAFAVSRFSWRFNTALLIVFTAGNLLPAQTVAAPIFLIFKNVGLPYWLSDSGSLLNSYGAVIMTETAFQVGFCTFVLANYMKALPTELTEAAVVDGAGVFRMYWSIVLPLCRPALGALGTLITIFVYNGFFWPLLLIQSPERLPVTTAVNLLKGQFSINYNLVAAGAVITLIPTLIIYLLLQRQFLSGLTLGASKG